MKPFTRSLILTLMALAAVGMTARAQESKTILIENATIITITHGNIDQGSLLIRAGKIPANGTDFKAREGATVIGATGQFVMPGIIDCHSHNAMDRSVNQGGTSVT